MRERDPILNMLVSADHFESLDRYECDRQDFIEPTERQLPSDWLSQRQGTWFYCSPSEARLPVQGWKIHLSATPANASEVLRRVVDHLVPRRVAFKMLVDRRIFGIANGKIAARGRSGKFITVYPNDRTMFLELLEGLHSVTADLEGPYILSDRRYGTSRVVHYRYGAIAAPRQVTLRGEMVSPLRDPEGNAVSDRRDPEFALPDWEMDPVQPIEATDGGSDEGTLKQGRYRVINALAFKNSGGVYLAHDNERSERVVIKEARPHVYSTAEEPDAVAILRKEHRLLTKLNGLCAPRALDWFTDWEHSFLVEEYLQCLTLGQFWVRHNPLLARRPTARQLRDYWQRYRQVGSAVARALQQCHEAGVVIGDVSAHNVLVEGDLARVWLIDLEGAFEPGVDAPIRLFTPEYMAPECSGGGLATQASDRYAFGMLLLASMFPITVLRRLDSRLPEKLLEEVAVDLAMPEAVRLLINRLVAADPSTRPTWQEVQAELARVEPPGPTLVPREVSAHWEPDVIDRACNYLESVATFERRDQLFPCDHYALSTNPLSVGYGAAGVGWVLHQCGRPIGRRVADWIVERLPTTPLPPGIMNGYAGVACALLDIGADGAAAASLKAANDHPLAHTTCDLLNGHAGVGLANLYFLRATRDERYLEHAQRTAVRIRGLAVREGDTAHWRGDGDVLFGLGEGAAGVSAFLLQFFKATQDQEWLDLGLAALRFELANADATPDGGLSWRQAMNGSRAILPYWGAGAAGVGSVLAQYLSVVTFDWLREGLNRAWIDTDRKWTVFPGMFNGISGIGHFHLDMYALTGEDKYLRAAERAASVLRVFAIDRGDGGLAFPGHRLLRLTADLSTGSAGIILFLQRFLAAGAPRGFDWFWPGDIGVRSGNALYHAATAREEVRQ